jgi:hypothetical protein
LRKFTVVSSRISLTAVCCAMFATSAMTVFANPSASPSAALVVDVAKLDGSRDLSLPAWGPYTKDYIGVSHIPDADQGLRFDLTVFPGYYRRASFVPNVFFESGFHPWRAAPNLDYFEFRHDIEWKDQVYADIAYSKYGDDARIVTATMVNHTDLPQSLSLHFAASMHFPTIAPYQPHTPLLKARAVLPEHGIWVDGLDYTKLTFATPRPDDNLVYDGWLRGELRDHHLVNGSGIGRDFGAQDGDAVSYAFEVPAAFKNAAMVLRYRSKKALPAKLKISGDININPSTLVLPITAELQTVSLELGPLQAGKHVLELTSIDNAAFDLDGFAIVDKESVAALQFPTQQWDPVPKITDGPVPHSVMLKYPDADAWYGLRWYFENDSPVRQIFNGGLSGFYEQVANDHINQEFIGDRKGHYTNVYLQPINLIPHSQRRLYAIVAAGTQEQVKQRLANAPPDPTLLEPQIAKAQAALPPLAATSSGEPYRFSVEKLAAVLATNIVYPVYTQHQYIRHSAPGRWWDSLYTWDSGFIGLGLLELDPQRSLENLNAYLTSQDSQSAFIHHGSPVPVQHYLFQELWNRTQSKEMLRYAYPKLKRYYAFLAGAESSTTNAFSSGLLKTWDYFSFNTGGWDDLSPQKYVRENKISNQAAPVVTTAHVIRIAKILRNAAGSLGLPEDVMAYNREIDRLSAALQKYSWDQESGYFSYVMHDKQGDPSGILRTKTGENFNKTLDGVAPLVAGVATPDQQQRLLAHLKNEHELFSKIGLTAVDQSASYYDSAGYWNGTVWMPHQWFMWKTMLDLGEHEFAHKIAVTALNLWKRETEATHASSEHFVIETERSAGWQQFGGLSAPILSWYAAYFTPGTLTVGLDGWVEKFDMASDYTSLQANIRFGQAGSGSSKQKTILLVLDEHHKYGASWNGKKVAMRSYTAGSYAIEVPAEDLSGTLSVQPM